MRVKVNCIIKQFPTSADRCEAFLKYREEEFKVSTRVWQPTRWPWDFYYTADTSADFEKCSCLVLPYEDPHNPRIPQAEAEFEARRQTA